MTRSSALDPAWLPTILAACRQEYPNAPRHLMLSADDRPTPAESHPAFYGCLDWHSAVEMHWAASRVARNSGSPDAMAAVADLFDQHLTPRNVAREVAYLEANPGFERPYGWGWLLQLADELADLAEPRWSRALTPLAEAITRGFIQWLPRTRLPNRQGTHLNTSFALCRSWPWATRLATAGRPELRDAIVAAARRWHDDDRDYPARWEPSGNDFLSPALAEAELISLVMAPDEFSDWLDRFLPGLANGEPPSLFQPVHEVDGTDGQEAHLLGLNLHRAAALSSLLPALSDHRLVQESIDAHLAASLPAVSGEHWMVEHWLAAFAVLALDPRTQQMPRT